MFAKIKPPVTGMDIEDFNCVVTMLRVGAAGGLSGAPYVEAMWFGNVNELLRIFRNARANNGEIFFLVRTRRSRIDERVEAGLQFIIPKASSRAGVKRRLRFQVARA